MVSVKLRHHQCTKHFWDGLCLSQQLLLNVLNRRECTNVNGKKFNSVYRKNACLLFGIMV